MVERGNKQQRERERERESPVRKHLLCAPRGGRALANSPTLWLDERTVNADRPKDQVGGGGGGGEGGRKKWVENEQCRDKVEKRG